ncbi:MAG TPA: DUF2339 domain-containing protein, partial [Sphingomicrobium sp.]|nr:DUF2339 domain-containing protein [Sphingomicrobium sp.]
LAAEVPGEPPPEPEPVVETVEEERPGGFGFEELFGRRLPIWAGGITLAVAGMLIVKLSIEAGLLSPPVRVIMGSIFGLALIGAAELALRQEERVRDERVRQALAGAGIASLYASILVAANLYHLVGPLMAMLGMAAVTALALGLSLRFGAPSALLGLAGGLAAPALIGSDEPNVPLLSLYLALAVGGLTTVSRSQRWAWLGISALVGGFGWGLLLMLGGALSAPDSISVALYLLLLGVALPMLGFAGGWQDRLRLIAAVAAAAQMAALVATGGFSLLNWGLFGLLSLAMLWLASREPSLKRLPPVGLVIALLLLGAWPDPAMREFALVAGAAALIYGVPALARLWRSEGGLPEAGQLSAITIGNLLIPMLHFYRADGSTDVGFGLLALSLAGLAALCAGLGWRHKDRREDARFAILATSSALLLAAAVTLLLPGWAIGGAMAAVGLGLLHLGQLAEDHRLEPIAWILAAAGLLAGPTSALNEAPADWQELLRWGLLAAVAAAFAWRARFRHAGFAAQFLAPILLFAALQPIVPERWEPLMAPFMLVALAAVPLRLVPAMAACILLLIGWAVVPIVNWVAEAGPSSVGDPMFVTDVATVDDALLKLLVPAALLGLSLWLARGRLERRELLTGSWIGGVLAAVALHSLYKQLFAIGSYEAFVAYGLAERTLWEALLLAGAAALWRLGQRQAAAILLGAGLAHFILYTLLLHNPLGASQAVGALPILNLIPLAYAMPVAALLAIDRVPPVRVVPERLLSLAWMVLILLFAASMLRQLFHGSLLVDPGLSQAEDIARSILAIALAIGFLLWGIRTKQREWRIGSLVLMLAAVAKVFLWDTQGLEGLVRIASFVALGFSLIGIGWLYSRQLARSKA